MLSGSDDYVPVDDVVRLLIRGIATNTVPSTTEKNCSLNPVKQSVRKALVSVRVACKSGPKGRTDTS